MCQFYFLPSRYLYYTLYMWHLLYWCGFADLSHYEKELSWVVNCLPPPPSMFLCCSVHCCTGWHMTHKKFFFSLCKHAHHVQKIDGISRLHRLLIFISNFLYPKPKSSRATLKVSPLINIHPTPVPQSWTLICSFLFSLYHHHVSILYYTPNPIWDFIAKGGGGRKERT
jgi:hypothetical protein